MTNVHAIGCVIGKSSWAHASSSSNAKLAPDWLSQYPMHAPHPSVLIICPPVRPSQSAKMTPSKASCLPSLLLLLFFASVRSKIQPGSQEFWIRNSRQELERNRATKPIEGRARNMILFIGDGMSIPTVTAARIFKAQKAGQKRAEETLLNFEDVPYVGLSKTHTEDFIVADSAATATAMLTGVKVNSLTVGVDSRVKFKNCSSYTSAADLKNLFAYAREAGMATGLVTTTSLTHATPSAAYAHSACRYWMSDKDLKKGVPDASVRSNCVDLATQFLANALDIDVVLAGGLKKLVGPKKGGEREDGKDIPSLWLDKQTRAKRSAKYVQNKDKLLAAAKTNVDRLLGIFAKENLPYYDERALPNNRGVPTLAEMVNAALTVMQRRPKGFFLLVEGGRIDHAHHYGYGRRALEEVLGLDEAFSVARRRLRESDSLLITTADHAHVFSMGGYPARGADIFGFPTQDTEGKGVGKATDGKPFTILAYANGPGAEVNRVRPDLTGKDTKGGAFRQQALVPLRKETHGGDDVGIYASGPMAHLVSGVREQNYIAHVFLNAACLGPYAQEEHCAACGKMASMALVALTTAVLRVLLR